MSLPLPSADDSRPGAGLALQANREGVSHHREGRFAEAEACYRRALELGGGFPEAHNNLGIIARSRRDFIAAEQCFRSALKLRPAYAQALNNLGNVLRDQSRHAEAKSTYYEALKVDPDMEAAFANLCNLLEVSNEIDELRAHLDNMSAGRKTSLPNLVLAQARLLRRERQYAEALALLAGLPLESLKPSVAGTVLALQGDLHDRMNEHARAFECFEQGKLLEAKVSRAFGADKAVYLNHLADESRQFDENRSAQWTREPSSSCQMVFLIGFPRSGTTLLDSILRSHSAIDVIEEKPMLSKAIETMEELAADVSIFDDRFDTAHLSALRKVYLEELSLHRDKSRPNAIIVDKLPLNISHGGLIRRLFPGAKFILALRDPRDCVLSCFMQPFMPNHAMANFLTLAGTANLYDQVMGIWQHYEQSLQLPTYRIHYEDIVADLPAAIQPMLSFLGLPWEPALTDFQKTAIQRGRINTPSYHQVVQPLYGRASGRWRNYRQQLESVLSTLDPWVDEFGYEK